MPCIAASTGSTSPFRSSATTTPTMRRSMISRSATQPASGSCTARDGIDGAERRIAAASRHVDAFGVATECGIGRAPAGVTEDLFRTHASVALGALRRGASRQKGASVRGIRTRIVG